MVISFNEVRYVPIDFGCFQLSLGGGADDTDPEVRLADPRAEIWNSD